MRDVFNFSAGPSMMPEEVLKSVQENFVSYEGSGMCVAEMSHRNKIYDEIHQEAMSLFKELLGVPEDYYVLFLQGGASTQFSAVPLNLLDKIGDKADYIVTGNFAGKAYEEGQRYADAKYLFNGKPINFTEIPDVDTLEYRDDAKYVHFTYNNTIFGTRFTKLPKRNNLVTDASSMILSEPMDVSKFNLIYAGAQKNVAPSGLTIVVVKKSLVDDKDPIDITPLMLQYRTQAKKDSMYNTPTTFSTYVAMLNFRWLKKFGGVDAIYKQNVYKANLLYNYLDDTTFYTAPAAKKDRSLMNVTFVTPSPELDAKFVSEAKANGLIQLKGHKLVGGLRASIYNAMPVEGVQKLVDFMKKFEMENK